MGTASKPNRAIFLAMEDLGLTGWLPGSGRRIAVRTGRSEDIAVQGRKPSGLALERERVALPTSTVLLVVATAIGAVTFLALASSLFARRK